MRRRTDIISPARRHLQMSSARVRIAVVGGGARARWTAACTPLPRLAVRWEREPRLTERMYVEGSEYSSMHKTPNADVAPYVTLSR